MNEADLLEVAIAVEKVSEHPIASAIVRDGEERLGKETNAIATGVTSITGRGLKGMLDGVPVYIGKEDPTLPEDLNLKLEELKSNGRTTMVVRRGEDYLGLLGVMDTPRPGAKEMIARLRELGIHRMIMISGDNQKVATAVAKVVGLDEARGDLMPEDKVKAIGDLRLEEEVAMVGDGVNDAPAMAYATVGIAMGAAGSDVALETADVALMGDKLSLLPFAVGLSRKTNRIIRQNVWISLGMVAILVPASLFGLSLGIAVLFHEGSTVAVVLNALRLLAYRSDTD
jgi:Cd2+/Zn2+-exporting ATPase